MLFILLITKEHFPNPSRFSLIEVSCSDTTLDELSLTPSYIKIDTQGSELDILKGSTNSIRFALALQIEVEFEALYADQPLFPQICEFMSHNGFTFVGFPDFRHWDYDAYANSGFAIWADAFFIANKILPHKKDPKDQLDDDTLLKSTLIALVHRRLGLARHLLSELKTRQVNNQLLELISQLFSQLNSTSTALHQFDRLRSEAWKFQCGFDLHITL